MGEIELAIVPVENSTQGSVTMTLDSIWRWDQLQIRQALVLPVHHALISCAQSLSQVQAVYSHPQSLAQCQNWLADFLPQAQQIPVNSNTEKIADLAQNPGLSVIASPNAAKFYDLPVLVFPINDFSDNATKFWVLGLKNDLIAGSVIADAPNLSQYTSLAFTAKYNEPGALVKPLAVFAQRQINLTRIESRPSRRSHNPYIFFIEIEAASTDTKAAILEVQKYTETLKIFGSYDIYQN